MHFLCLIFSLSEQGWRKIMPPPSLVSVNIKLHVNQPVQCANSSTLLLCEPGVKHVMLYESIQPQFNKRILPTSQEKPNQEVIQQVMLLSVWWNGVSACCHSPSFISCFEMRFSRWTVDLRDRLRKQSSTPPPHPPTPSTLRGWWWGGHWFLSCCSMWALL